MPTAKPTLDPRVLTPALTRAVQHVLESNLGRRTVACAPSPAGIGAGLRELGGGGVPARERHYINVIELGGGADLLLGTVVPQALAFAFATEYLGYPEYELEFDTRESVQQIYRDTTGEVTNMICGNVRNILSRANVNCRMTPPRLLPTVRALAACFAQQEAPVLVRFEAREFWLAAFHAR